MKRRGFLSRAARRCVVVLGAIALIAPTACAQIVLGISEPAPRDPRVLQGFGQTPPVPDLGTPILERFALGGFRFLPHASYQFLRASGLQVAPGQPETSEIDTFTAGLLVRAGTMWSLDYSVRRAGYSNPAFRTAIGHTAALHGAVTGQAWAAELAQRYATSDSPTVETGRQTKQQAANTTLTALYRPAPHLSFDVTFTQDLSFVERTGDTFEWSLLPGIRYLHSPRVQAGLGVAAGYVLIYGAPDLHYQRPTAQLTVRLSDRTSLDLQGGVERWDLGRAGATSNSTHYSASLLFAPAPTTTLMFRTTQGTSVNPFFGQATEATGWNIEVAQRLLKHLQLSYRHSSREVRYLAAGLPDADRSDELVSDTVRASFIVLRHGTVSGFWARGRNRSSLPGFGFTSRQVGFEIGLRF